MRKGFYLVRTKAGREKHPDLLFRSNEWQPAYWDGKDWWLIGQSSPDSEDEGGLGIAAVGRRLTVST